MIGSTLQLSLNRAKVSFLPCGTNEKFINLCRIGGTVEGEGWLRGRCSLMKNLQVRMINAAISELKWTILHINCTSLKQELNSKTVRATAA